MALWGTEDAVVPMQPALSLIQAHVPGINVRIVEGIGHFLMWEKPQETIDRVAEFLLSPSN
jgi:pimeloyl-ACP methyl ester carboxylesterase